MQAALHVSPAEEAGWEVIDTLEKLLALIERHNPEWVTLWDRRDIEAAIERTNDLMAIADGELP